MTLTKADITQYLTRELDYPQKRSVRLVENLLEIIKQALESGEDVLVSGFGKFCVKEKSEQKGRNPANGEDLILRARKVVTFKCSGKLRNRINKR